MTDSYYTIRISSGPEIFKDKNSKFFGYAFPFNSENDLKPIITTLKKEHQNAGHFCYAYQLGTEQKSYKVNDDGEPNNSAGLPIFGQIQSFHLTNVLIVVVRYFGGVKLGVSGLIKAYRSTARQILEHCEIIEQTIDVKFELEFDYKNMSKVMQILKKLDAEITEQTLTENCKLQLSVRKGNKNLVFERFRNFYGVEINEL